MEADATITIGGDARGAVAASVATARAYTEMAAKIAGDTDALRRRVEADRKAMQEAAERQARAERKAAVDSVDAWGKVDVTGLFRPWFEARKQWLEGAEKIGTSAATQRAALLLMAGAATTGAAAVAAAAVTASAAVVASSVDIIAHLDASTLAISRHDEALIEANAAYLGLGKEVTALRVELAGQLAPALGYTFDVMAGVVTTTNDLASGMADLADGIGINAGAAARWVPVLGQVLYSMDILAERGREVREEAERTAAAVSAGAAIGAALRKATAGPRFNMEEEARAVAAAQAEADAMMLVARETAKATTATTAHTAAVREQATQAVPDMTAAYDAASASLETYLALQRSLRETINQGVQGVAPQGMPDATVSGSFGIDQAPDVAEKSKKSASDTLRAWQSAYGGIVSAAASSISAIISLSSDLTESQIGDSRKLSAHQMEEMRKQFRRAKAAAMAQALINGALAFTSALSTPPIYVGIALAALTAVATGLQVAKIANTPPPQIAHTGGAVGLAPDEADIRVGGRSVRTLQSEVLAVVPSRGGQTDRDVRRLATGEAGDAERLVYVVMGGPPQALRLHAGGDPGYGRRGR